MDTQEKTKVTIHTSVNVPVEKAWKMYNDPIDVVKWNTASPDWHTPKAENDFRTGGNFVYRMEAKDGSFGFDFGGTYDRVEEHSAVDYTLGDGRQVWVSFSPNGNGTDIKVVFEAETQNPVDMQRDGWQAILNNFKAYAEAN